MFRLVLANDDEIASYRDSGVQSGLPRDLDYLRRDPLARSSLGRPSGRDHIHLSVPDSNPRLVQWWGRGSTGYHYPIGPVMKMIPAED